MEGDKLVEMGSRWNVRVKCKELNHISDIVNVSEMSVFCPEFVKFPVFLIFEISCLLNETRLTALPGGIRHLNVGGGRFSYFLDVILTRKI